MKRTLLLPVFAIACAGTLIAQAQPSTITGRLLGSDGKPMPKAHVHLLLPQQRQPFAAAEVNPDGTFQIQTDRTGMITLQFTGAYHQSHQIPLLIEIPRRIALDVTLGPRAIITSFDDVKIIGDFNDFDFQTPKSLTKGKNGVSTATFKTDAAAFTYQILVGSDPRSTFSMNGTQSEDYIYDGGGDYRSLVTPKKGKVTITFDPAKMPRTAAEASVMYHDSATARLAAIVDEMERQQRTFMMAWSAHAQSGNADSAFNYDWSKEMAAILERSRAESDPLVRNALLLQYTALTLNGRNADPEVARRVLREIPPTSQLWALDPKLMDDAIAGTDTPEKFESYRWEAIEKHPDSNVRMTILANTIANAYYGKEPEKLRRYYDYMVAHFPDHQETRYVKAQYGPDRNVMAGKSVPPFTLASLDNASETLSSEQMKGKYYMIDFWATWCGPCVAEMASLHRAYERFHGRNFEIISLSFDGRPDAVRKFRDAKWKMPWRHGFVEGNFDSKLAEQFEVVGIPKPILVDGNGMIVAVGEELRGKDLERTLERVLGVAN